MPPTFAHSYTKDQIFIPTDAAARVLHVVDPSDETISSALSEYLVSTRHLEHWVLIGGDSSTLLRFLPGAEPAGIISLPIGRRARLRALADAYNKVKPSRVHAHSFSAGAYVRLTPSIPADSIVYSPHCYEFERRDHRRAKRVLIATCEYLLAPRARTVAVCTAHEAQLAARLHRTAKIVHVPCVPRSDTLDPSALQSPATLGSVAVAVGPLSSQRDPAFFAAVAAAARSNITWIWIGDGEPRYKRLLEKAGVCVTGHRTYGNVLHLLRSADVYVHTAAWEGNCDTLLQAVAADLPIAARSIPALEALRLPGLASTPAALADRVHRLLTSPLDRRASAESARRAFRSHTAGTQAARLRELYESNR
ncbi:glycosyltransferase [Streptomyces sp. NPDC059680]|uniref:glycosyltransferase n=1 Tax=Streptomyces sp. NPDC059680 TaxID=3346904 RepID=UPI0036CED677